MSWLISPVADWWWDYECISGIIIDDCFWYPRGNHYSCRKIARKWAQHKSMRARLQRILVTRWANAAKHLLSLCIYIISYLSSKSKKPHNQVATQLSIKFLICKGRADVPPPAISFSIIAHLSSNFKPLCDCILCSRTGVFLFLYFSLDVLFFDYAAFLKESQQRFL